jgi:prepilin-type N-terminal cleavage/methylation domain-containing protein
MPQPPSSGSTTLQADANKGFTLIELLVVISIVGLLAVVAMVGMNVARAKSRDTKRVADIRQIQKALEIFYGDNLGYPTVATATNLGEGTALALCGNALAATCTGTAYMTRVPDAPQIVESGCAASNYVYTSSATSGTSSSYSIAFCLGNAVGDLAAGVRSATPGGIQ